MGRKRMWRNGVPYLKVAFRVTREEKKKLRLMCAELDMTIQEFLRKLLKLERYPHDR